MKRPTRLGAHRSLGAATTRHWTYWDNKGPCSTSVSHPTTYRRASPPQPHHQVIGNCLINVASFSKIPEEQFPDAATETAQMRATGKAANKEAAAAALSEEAAEGKVPGQAAHKASSPTRTIPHASTDNHGCAHEAVLKDDLESRPCDVISMQNPWVVMMLAK